MNICKDIIMNKMKTGKKVMAGTLAAIMVSSAALTAYAATEHWNDGSQGATSEWTQWKTDWETIKDDYEKVSVNLGADETQLSFARYCYDLSYYQLINSNNICIEIMQRLAGTIGIVLTVPFTSLLAAVLIKRHPARKSTD